MLRINKCFIFMLMPYVLTSALKAEDQLRKGEMKIESNLTIDYITNRLGTDWSVTKSGKKDINNTFSKTAVSTNSFQSSSGQTLDLTLSYKPFYNLYGYLNFLFVNDYANRYYMPINIEHRLNVDNTKFLWKKGEIIWGDKYNRVRFFKGVGHYNWNANGDMFNLFPEQFDEDNYLRISGRSTPEGFELSLGGIIWDLDVYYGPEVVWGYKNAMYARYNITTGVIKNAFIMRDHEIPYGAPDERLRTYEYSLEYDFLQAGVLYQPFRLNRDYVYTEEVSKGTGIYNTDYLRKTGTTEASDGVGYSVKLSSKKLGFIDDSSLKFTRLGLLAGNKQEYALNVSKDINRNWKTSLEYINRKPIMGPLPLIYQGTVSNTGPAIFIPRGEESPFQVNWSNREADIISIMCSYDKTPKTRFFVYEPGIFDSWNINKKEDSDFAFACKYTLSKYPTATDRMYYINENGKYVWEPISVSGAWASNAYLGVFDFVSCVNRNDWQYFWRLGFGESLAAGSLAYNNSTNKEKPATGFFTTGISAEHNNISYDVKYSQNIWGPEDWHKTFGQTYDKLYQAAVAKKFFKSMKAGIEYTGAREEDNLYIANDLGDYDEIRCFLTLSFGPISVLF